MDGATGARPGCCAVIYLIYLTHEEDAYSECKKEPGVDESFRLQFLDPDVKIVSYKMDHSIPHRTQPSGASDLERTQP